MDDQIEINLHSSVPHSFFLYYMFLIFNGRFSKMKLFEKVEGHSKYLNDFISKWTTLMCCFNCCLLKLSTELTPFMRSEFQMSVCFSLTISFFFPILLSFQISIGCIDFWVFKIRHYVIVLNKKDHISVFFPFMTRFDV